MSKEINTASKERFKCFLRKIGSGENTSKSMNREEAAEALEIMLKEEASPAQIGAFMIAHRIRRPKPNELAGMLDTYKKFGPKLISLPGSKAPICFGMPFDGRNKTAPIYPLTTLILVSHEQPVILQGGREMPVKYGVTTRELFSLLGLELQNIPLETVQNGFQENKFAFIYQPDHFPMAEVLINYRDEIAKRTTIATIELLWSVHEGQHLLINGYFHPPTEDLGLKTLQKHGERNLIFIKGLEGSVDISINHKSTSGHLKNEQYQHLTLNPLDYNLSSKEVKWEGKETWLQQALEAINDKGPLRNSLIWNSAIYLWFSGMANDLEDGIEKAYASLKTGIANDTLLRLIKWRESINQ